ncbi:MAG: transposase [Clostridiales bacterium]|nr:transposase [Clostridiales bacterium]
MAIFMDSQDKEVFLNMLRQAQILFGFQIFVYCIMLNHYHLLFKDTGKQLPFAIGWIQQNYAIYFNAKYNHCGAVFMKPFKSKIVLNKAHFFTEVCYILNNPVKAEIVNVYSDYKWNSPLTGYEKYNITDYLYLHVYYEPINNLSLSEYIKRRSRSKKISTLELENLSDKDAKNLFFKIINNIGGCTQFSSEILTKKSQKEIISEALYQGISFRQVSDITNISKTSIFRMKSTREYI